MHCKHLNNKLNIVKPFIKSLLLLFLLTFLSNTLIAQNNCGSLFDFLEKKGFEPQVQLLTAGGTNNLPYNIIVNFLPKDKENQIKSPKNLIILFNIDEAWAERDNIIPVLELLKEQNYSSSAVFCYGSRLNIPRENIIYGSEIFARSLNSDGNSHVYIFNLNSSKNSIISGSNGHHSPSWMLKDMFDAYSSAKLTDGLPVYYISQTADFSFATDKTFLSFLNYDIPCVLGNIKDSKKIDSIAKSIISSFEESSLKPDDSHTFMFRIFGKRIWLSEFRIINALIIIVVLGFLFIFCLGFINKNIKREFWHEIATIWYALPIIYILSYCGFFAGKGLYSLFAKAASQNYTVYGFFILQIAIATFFVSAFYMANLTFQKKYTTRSLDFLLLIDTFINLVIFTLVDISLFPIFLMIFAVALISFIFRRNWIHIILFVFLIIPFIPYINSLFEISDKESLHMLLVKSNTFPFLISLVLLPVYLMWLRILNSMKKRYAKKRVYASVLSAMFLFIILSLVIINKIFYSDKKFEVKEIDVIKADSQAIREKLDFDISWKDKSIFDDTIRNIEIVSKMQPVYVSVKISGKNPVLYSENDFTNLPSQNPEEKNTAEFLLPLYPPQKLEFNYGTDTSSQEIFVEEIIYNEEDKAYYSLTKSVIIEKKNE